MKVKPPSQKLVAASNALSSAPPKRLPVETVRAQVIQHLSESRLEILRVGQEKPGR
jgi:hypothetical protein